MHPCLFWTRTTPSIPTPASASMFRVRTGGFLVTYCPEVPARMTLFRSEVHSPSKGCGLRKGELPSTPQRKRNLSGWLIPVVPTLALWEACLTASSSPSLWCQLLVSPCPFFLHITHVDSPHSRFSDALPPDAIHCLPTSEDVETSLVNSRTSKRPPPSSLVIANILPWKLQETGVERRR